MNKKINKVTYLLHAIVFSILVFIDQYSKFWVRNTLVEPNGTRKSIDIIKNVFCLQYLENRGSVWGIMQGKISFLLIVSLILFAILVYVYVKIPKTEQYKLLLWLDVIMLAGAVGNTVDRIVFGYVTDFLYFELINFPIFNFADCLITVISVLTVVLILTRYKSCDFEFLSLRKEKSPEDKKDEADGKSNTDN